MCTCIAFLHLPLCLTEGVRCKLKAITVHVVGHYKRQTDGRIGYHACLYLQLRMIFGPLGHSSWTVMYFDHMYIMTV